MSTINTMNDSCQTDSQRVLNITEKHGRTTYDVHVLFSQTSKETLTDKVMRLIRNDMSLNDML